MSNTDQFKPRSMINCSSMEYNVISLRKPRQEGISRKNMYSEEKICNKKKAQGEISDLGRLYNPNFHPDYKDYYKKNNIVFLKYKGYCSPQIDEGFKNGNQHKLFYKYRGMDGQKA